MSATVIQVIENSPSETSLPPSCVVTGSVAGSLGTPAGFFQWIYVGSATEGSELAWHCEHGDEALYVLSGALVVDGKDRCQPAGTVIIESGAQATVRALEALEFVLFGTSDAGPTDGGVLGAPYPFDHGIHVINVERSVVNRHSRPDGTFSEVFYYADGVCRTCRVSLQRVGSPFPTG